MMLGYFEYFIPSIEPDGRIYSLLELTLLDGGLAFHGIDKNHDGLITLQEYPSSESFHAANVDRDEVVTRDEFRAFWKKRNLESERSLSAQEP